MKKLANTLYVTTDGSYLARERETVVIRLDGQDRLRVPIHALESIVCFGRVGASPALMGLCGERGVALSFMSQNGRFLAQVKGPVSGNVLLRRTQFRLADRENRAADLARMFVKAKIANCRRVAARAAGETEDEAISHRLTLTVDRLAAGLTLVDRAEKVDEIRGREGEAGRIYFEAFADLIGPTGSDFAFRGRSRRPPLDPVNALLSFLYVILAHDVRSALEGVGLDPSVGFLHADRPGRYSLALDLMEEFRPYLADRLVLSLINRRQVKISGFEISESGAVMMDEKTRKIVLEAWQKRKQDELTHPFLQEKIKIGLLPHIQALLLARHIRGDLDCYPPFFWR